MELSVVIFWTVCLSCLAGMISVFWRFRSGARGWLGVYFLVLLVCGLGGFWDSDPIIYTGGGLWVALILMPGLLSLRYHRLLLQQRYDGALRFARLIRLLHPADGWREQPEIVRALDLAQRGELSMAVDILGRYQTAPANLSLSAVANLYRLTNRWEEFLEWAARNRNQVERRFEYLPLLLRARGEVGDIKGLIELYERYQRQIAGLAPVSQRDFCRLMLFAFCGQRANIEQLYQRSLSVLPATIQRFWLATADASAGHLEMAQRQLQELLVTADAQSKRAIERRLGQLSNWPAVPTELATPVVAVVASEQSQEERFGDRRGLSGAQVWATRVLLGVNILMYFAEIKLGGGTNQETLLRMGAMNPAAVRDGEWWRLLAATFLHFGPVHLVMNMIALALLGPYVEFALGRLRFVAAYLVTGVASMGAVLILGQSDQITVGASGCVMGLVGATGALMLRGWLREKAAVAKRRLLTIIAVLLVQTIFDYITPQVSMTAHLAGALTGFVAALGLRHRLNAHVQSEAKPA